MADAEGSYRAKRRVTIAETPNLRVRLLSLGDGQCVPWHYHSNITDTFFCMEGPMRVSTRNPDGEYVLEPGGTCAINPRTAHHVAGVDGRPCKFMIVQGVGAYDYVPVSD